MAYTKKTWVDRSVEHPGRRKLSAVTGETDVYDIIRSEGTITTAGDAFSADNMNDLETRIKSGMDDLETYVDDAIETVKPITKTNISVSVTPTQLSTYMNWDTENKYGYSAAVIINGLTSNSMIQNIVMTDTLMDSIAPIITTGANSLTFYTENSTKLSGTIFTLVTVEVS